MHFDLKEKKFYNEKVRSNRESTLKREEASLSIVVEAELKAQLREKKEKRDFKVQKFFPRLLTRCCRIMCECGWFLDE